MTQNIQLALCPFDKSHKIEPSKLLTHIKKCNAPNRKDYEQCPYNPTHWYNFQHLLSHKQQCPNRNMNYSIVQNSNTNTRKHTKRSQNNSYISEISKNLNDSFDSDIEKIRLNFQIDAPVKMESNQNSDRRKKINKKQMKQLNEPSLWKQPNFTDWFDNYNQKRNKNTRPSQLMGNRYFYEEDY